MLENRHKLGIAIWCSAAAVSLLLIALVLNTTRPVAEDEPLESAESPPAGAPPSAPPAAKAPSGAPESPTSVLMALSQASQELAQRVAPSVVRVDASGLRADDTARRELRRFFGRAADWPEAQQASGVIVHSDGEILTNYHVVVASERLEITLADGRTLPAQLAGRDLALLRVEAHDLPAATWGDSNTLAVGALVWAVGNPFGLERSVTLGIISAKNRQGLLGNPYHDLLQTDAAINPGNSGGPLVDVHGQVVGINTAIAGDSYRGVGFAIPSNSARDVYQQLRASGHVTRGWLGIGLEAVPAAPKEGPGSGGPAGVLLAEVIAQPPSPAAAAGLRKNDVIVTFNGVPVDSPVQLSRLIAQCAVGSQAQVEVQREGQRITFSVTVGTAPDGAP